MTLPFVTRATHDRIVADLREELTQAARDLAVQRATWNAERDSLLAGLAQRQASAEHESVRAEARYAELMAAYRSLRQQGMIEPPKPLPPEGEPDPIEAAILQASRGMSPAVRAAMRQQAALDRQKMPVDMVVQRIAAGHRPMDEVS